MKKVFLSLCLMTVSLMGLHAQQPTAPSMQPTGNDAQRLPHTAAATTAQYADHSVSMPMQASTNRVYYQRDFGTYYANYIYYTTIDGVPNSPYPTMYFVGAPFVQLTFKNMAADKEKATFQFYNHFYRVWGNLAMNDDRDYQMTPTRGASYYIPQIVYDDGEVKDTFYIGQQLGHNDYVYTHAFDSLGIAPMSLTDNTLSYDYFSDFGAGVTGSFYGSNHGEASIGHCTKLWQYFPKPVSTLAINKICFAGYSFNRTNAANSIKPFADGSKITMTIVRGSDPNGTDIIARREIDNSNLTLTYYDQDVQATYNEFEVSLANGNGSAHIVNDLFGIDSDFTLVFDGFDPERADVGIGNSDQSQNYWDGDRSATAPIRPTYTLYSDGKEYNLPTHNVRITFDAMFDAVAVVGSNTLTAPAEGGNCSFTSGENTYLGPQFQSARYYQYTGNAEPNYRIENLPDWLTVQQVATNNYNSAGGWTNIYVLRAEALPEGVSGRAADIVIVSDLGAKSPVYHIVQGDATGVKAIDNEQPTINNPAVYNLAGQRVGDDYKGIVIRNGHKVLRK